MAATIVSDLKLTDSVVKDVDGVSVGAGSNSIPLGAVRHNTQMYLTDVQKATARANIGASSTGYRGEFDTWESVPEEDDDFAQGVPQPGDTITINDVADYYSQKDIDTETLLYSESENDEGEPVKHICTHLYVGRRLAESIDADVLSHFDPDTDEQYEEHKAIAERLLSGYVLTDEDVEVIGLAYVAEADVKTIRFYHKYSGKWLLTYEGVLGKAYDKGNWVWKYQLNNDTELAVLVVGMMEALNEAIVG